MTISNKRRAHWASLWADPEWCKVLTEEFVDQRANPYKHSQLRYWLSLDLWRQDEGLLVLAGIEPGTVVDEVADEPWLVGENWSSAQPFREHFSFHMVPEPEGMSLSDFGGNSDAYQSYLSNFERRRQVLSFHETRYRSLAHRLDHTVEALGPPAAKDAWRPDAFLRWARSIKFLPDWLSWAEKNGLLPDQLDPARPPFFDADAPEYPELLAIAVRAWDAARSGSEGTPKQRIESFLAGSYPHLTQSTRSAIAMIANWNKAGGRPAGRK